MAEAPELPEAKNPFERVVAVSIAVMAVILAVISTRGDNAKADSLKYTNEKSNKWAQYQAKSIKKNITQLELKLAKSANAPSEDIDNIRKEIHRYEADEKIVSKEADVEAAKAEIGGQINDRCDLSALALQIAIVVSSVAILARFKEMWMMGLVLGAVGFVLGATSYFM